MKVIINDLNPFNAFYFRTCFLNSFFSIMQKYNINILHVIGDIEAYYSINQNKQLKLNFINDIHFRNLKADLSKLVSKSGMNIEYFNGMDLHIFIKNKINYNRPVIIIVDCFYLPYRNDTFEKRHLYHPILITGYDDMNYYIIDQINDESLTFNHRIVDFSILEKGYAAYIKLYKQEYITGLTSYGFEIKNNLIEDIRRKTILARKENIDVILNGLESLVQFKDAFCITGNTNSLESIVLIINDIINFLLIEKQKIIELKYEVDSELFDANIAVINLWTAIRREIYMCAISEKRRTSETKDRIINLIDKVYLSERKYYLLFYNK